VNIEVAPAYREELIAAGLLIPLGSDGLYARSGVFEAILEAIDALAVRMGADHGAEVLRLPPGMSRGAFEATGYMRSFPQLAGTVHCFCGDEQAHRELIRTLDCHGDWTEGQAASDIVLTPAACYPVYPIVARRGPLPADGHAVDVMSYCFRHEPSRDPARMQMFRMHEFVCMGSAAQAQAFRATWVARGQEMAEALRLPYRIEVANDPFFGRAGRLLATSQVEQALKLELLIPVTSGAAPTACMSFNYHQDKFGETWGLRCADGSVAHTACVGFGLERLTLALLRHHGFQPAHWPDCVRAMLRI
jgi:seryl-tRNA synthetase